MLCAIQHSSFIASWPYSLQAYRTMNIRIVQTLPEDEWGNFVKNHPDGNIFHTPEMFQVFSRAKGYQPTLWAAVDRSNRPLALLLPVQIPLMDGLLRSRLETVRRALLEARTSGKFWEGDLDAWVAATLSAGKGTDGNADSLGGS